MSALSDRIVRKLEATRGLLIIDEAQHLKTTTLDQVRSIFDAAHVGIVLAGNKELAAHLDIDRRRDQLAQISGASACGCARSIGLGRPISPRC